jgi:hypothetical protein
VSIFLGKPSKLTLRAYYDREWTEPAGTFTATYNPDSVRLGYQTDLLSDVFINTARRSNRYVQSEASTLTLDLLFDARMPGNRTPVETQIRQLLKFCNGVSPSKQSSLYLKVYWGLMTWGEEDCFAGRMSAMSINYTLFERDATPLRATATIQLTADSSWSRQQKKEQLLAPESAVVSVPDKATLPGIVKGIAGALAKAPDYQKLARDNDLDSIDAIKPGQTLKVLNAGGSEA